MFVCCLMQLFSCLMFVTLITNSLSISYERYYYKMYNYYYKMYMLLLQNVHAIITKCTCYYYKMYMALKKQKTTHFLLKKPHYRALSK
jgi:hypothetical protein